MISNGFELLPHATEDEALRYVDHVLYDLEHLWAGDDLDTRRAVVMTCSLKLLQVKGCLELGDFYDRAEVAVHRVLQADRAGAWAGWFDCEWAKQADR